MAEIAIISSSKARLKKMISDGNTNAQKVLYLLENPNRFLSTVQIGITLIGIVAGVFGGAAVGSELALIFQKMSFWGYHLLPSVSTYLAYSIVVILTTYLSLVLGELVPKRIAMYRPEKIACFIVRPMFLLSSLTSPFVSILSFSTDFILKLLHIKIGTDRPVSEDEVKFLMKEGAKAGVFEREEKDIFERTLRLGDKKASAIMTSRNEIDWINIHEPFLRIKKRIADATHSYFPICDGSLDHVLGVLRTEDLLKGNFWTKEKFDLTQIMHPPVFVPENTEALKVIELFRQSGIHTVLVVDEYGNIQGIVSINDILDGLLGDVPKIEEIAEKNIVKRDDNSFFIDGMTSTDEFKDFFKIKDLPGEEKDDYNTIGGFAMYMLGKIPHSGDKFSISEFEFEIMDMDGNRVDKLLLKKIII